MLSEQKYTELRHRIDAMDKARKAFDPKRYKTGGGWTPSDTAAIEKLAGVRDVTNDERSSVEVYEFVRDRPEKYVAYVDKDMRRITTWTGETLGDIVSKKAPTSGLGGKRVQIRVRGDNGETYSGPFYPNAGDYVRLRRVKSQRRNPRTSSHNPMKYTKWVVRKNSITEHLFLSRSGSWVEYKSAARFSSKAIARTFAKKHGIEIFGLFPTSTGPRRNPGTSRNAPAGSSPRASGSLVDSWWARR